ncbi:MAG: hypothetical protein ACOX7F_02850 [Eubacteriales bacterium]
MIYSREIPPMCAYCALGSPGPLGDVICPRKGVVKPDFHCGKYQYDPLKRIPPKRPRYRKELVEAEDFLLE